MTLVDIGCNLTNKQFARDIPDVIAGAARAGVGTLIVTGVSAAASRRAWEIAAAHDAGDGRSDATAGASHPTRPRRAEEDRAPRAALDVRAPVVDGDPEPRRANERANAEDARDAPIEATAIEPRTARAAAGVASRANAHAGHAVRVFSTAGVHPHHASTWSDDVERDLRDLLARPRVVAAGECGLDYDRDFSPRDRQRAAFEAQLALAADTGKPVFLHERAAHDDFARILARWRPKLSRAVVHCFTGDRAALDAYLALDLHVGLTGWICDERRGKHLASIVGSIPRGRLMIETDAPYIKPRDLMQPGDDRRNEPKYLPHIARAIAAARGETFDELAAHTTETARAFFGL